NRVIAKDAAKIILVRKNFILHWKKHTCGIDKVNNGKRALEGDALCADNFLGCLRKERTGFYRGIIGNNHAWNALDVAYARDHAGCRNFSPLLVHFVSSPKTDLEEW